MSEKKRIVTEEVGQEVMTDVSGWTMVSKPMERFACQKCGAESRIRMNTKRKVCKKCGAVYRR